MVQDISKIRGMGLNDISKKGGNHSILRLADRKRMRRSSFRIFSGILDRPVGDAVL